MTETIVFELDELVEMFGYRNRRAAQRKIRLGTFEVPTFTLAGRRVATGRQVANFFERQEKREARECN